MSTTTPIEKFEYDTYVVNVSNTPELKTDDMTALATSFVPTFASLAVKNAATGVAAPIGEEVADVFAQMYSFQVREANADAQIKAAYALVGFVAYKDKDQHDQLKFGVVSFNGGKVDNINFYKVVGDGMNVVKASSSALGVQNGTAVVFGMTGTKFMLPPKSFFLDGVHVNPFEPFPAFKAEGIDCVSTNIIGLKASA